MFPAVNTKDAAAVAAEARRVFAQMFPGADGSFIEDEFGAVAACFAGRLPGYQAIDARYHDLEHTMQGTLCLMRLLLGRHAAGSAPIVTEPMFEVALLAILLHDSGYLKRTTDAEGTGAKYTLTHVRRSAEFAREFLGSRGYSEMDIVAVQNLIRCTGVNVDLNAIPFASELERTLGSALGTADLLGQMAAPDYVDKLTELYQEFAEAVRFSASNGARAIAFKNADDLISNTPAFWRNYVWPKINEDFGQLYKFLNDPYPTGQNDYVERVRANVARIERNRVSAHTA